MKQRRTVAFPHMGSYHVPIQRLFQTLFPEDNVVAAPAMTRRTIELGARHSPDYICSPFKYNIGNYIEALEAGADVLLQTGMGCRYGYYGELQEQILKDLGYEFQFLCFSRERAKPFAAYQTIKGMGSPLSMQAMLRAFLIAVGSVHVIDQFEAYMRENLAFEQQKGGFTALRKELLDRLASVKNIGQVLRLRKSFLGRMRKIPLLKPRHILRVGVVGELYTLMEPFSNFYLEDQLALSGIAVKRKMSVTFLLFGKRDKRTIKRTGRYLRFPVGANGIDSVAQSMAYARQGYDGILHMKSFGCTPELNATPALDNISRDFGIPIMHLSFDAHTSETGIQTRIEAFADMIAMKRQEGSAEDEQSRRGYRFHFHQRRGFGRQ